MTTNVCSSCNKELANKYTLERHKSICKKIINNKDKQEIKESTSITELKTSNKFLENKINELKENLEKAEGAFEYRLEKQKREFEREKVRLEDKLEKQREEFQAQLEIKEQEYKKLMEKYHQLEISFITKNEHIPHFKILTEEDFKEHMDTILKEFGKGVYHSFAIFVTTVYKTVPPNIILADASRNKVKIFTGKWEYQPYDKMAMAIFDKSFRTTMRTAVPRYIEEQGIDGDQEHAYRMNMIFMEEVNTRKLAENIKCNLLNFKT